MNKIVDGIVMTNFQKLQKRGFDIIASFGGLAVLWPVILVTWWIARRDTGSTGFFKQERVGRNAKNFKVIKLRTMRAGHAGGTITAKNDARITPWGLFFRKWKLDELPQLWNVLKGEMSFVGPRPDVPGYLDALVGEDRILWTLRPGITGPASLKYKDEEDILAKADDATLYNDTVIWPDKIKLNIAYLDDWSLIKDINFIVKTIR
jgi:lipopolysaccharide/colanic/teichoic acid biosynthesis glycosyltransferase